MGKKNGSENGEVTAVVQNGQHVVHVQVKSMGMQEKARIEKLIDNRAEALREYLAEMEKFAMEANENTTLMDVEKSNEVKRQLALLTVERERLNGQKEGEVAAAENVLEAEKMRKLLAVQQAEKKVLAKYKELVLAVNDAAAKKYQKKEDDLTERENTLKLELAAMERAEKSEKLVRKVALSNSLRALKDDVGDYRNKAVEILHTEVVESGGAKTCLAMIPDATEFRRQVSPEKLFAVFNDQVKVKAISHSEVKCQKCGSTENLNEHTNGSMYCRKCGKYDVLPDSVKKMVVLPSLKDIAEAARVEKPGESSGRPVVEVNVDVMHPDFKKVEAEAAVEALNRCLDVRDAIEEYGVEKVEAAIQAGVL